MEPLSNMSQVSSNHVHQWFKKSIFQKRVKNSEKLQQDKKRIGKKWGENYTCLFLATEQSTVIEKNVWQIRTHEDLSVSLAELDARFSKKKVRKSPLIYKT